MDDIPAPESLPIPIGLSNRPTWRQVLTLAGPVLLQQFLIFAVTLCDALLAGRFRPQRGDHVASQAAQTTAMYLTWLISSYAVLVSVGSTALVARFTGAGDRNMAVRTLHQSLLFAAFLGLLGTTAGLIWVEELVSALQLTGETAEFAVSYLRPLFSLLTFQVIGSAGIACLIGVGDTRTGMWVLGSVAIINVPLAILFHHGGGPIPAMGFTGIALGTAVSQMIGGLAVLAILLRGRAGLRLTLPLLRPDFSLLRRLMRISVPAGLDSLMLAVGQLFFLAVINRLSTEPNGVHSVAAHGIALRCEAISFLLGTAFGIAAMTLVGQQLGTGRPDRAARSAWTAFALCGAVMCVLGIGFYVLAPQLFALFCPYEEQQPVIAMGIPVLRIIAFAMPPLASTIVFASSLRGAGDTRVPVFFTLIGFFVIRIPLAWFLINRTVDLGSLGVWTGADLGLVGAWLAMSADVFVRGLLLMLRFRSGRWRTIEV